MHFNWALDQKRLPELPLFDLTLDLPPDGPDAKEFVLRGIVTDQWGSSSEPFQQTFVISRPNAKITTVEAKIDSPPAEAISKGSTVSLPSSLDGDLTIEEPAADVEIHDKVLTHGYHVRIVARRLTSFAGTIVNDQPPWSRLEPASSGSDGAGGASAGADGRPGSPGQRGTDAQDGGPAHGIEIEAQSFSGILTVSNSGGRGQDGGPGGPGGRGGAGATGEPARSGIFDCRAGPGRGGNGGVGGQGGNGGNGGNGGLAGQVILTFREMTTGSQVRVDALRGSAGVGGPSGSGGLGGPGVRRGRLMAIVAVPGVVAHLVPQDHSVTQAHRVVPRERAPRSLLLWARKPNLLLVQRSFGANSLVHHEGSTRGLLVVI
jgi:hypothetical protein